MVLLQIIADFSPKKEYYERWKGRHHTVVQPKNTLSICNIQYASNLIDRPIICSSLTESWILNPESIFIVAVIVVAIVVVIVIVIVAVVVIDVIFNRVYFIRKGGGAELSWDELSCSCDDCNVFYRVEY